MTERQFDNNMNEVGGSFWRRFFVNLLPIEQRIVLGTVGIIATLAVLVWVGMGEMARMETFTAQYKARSIQRGAVIFNNNCVSCHGRDGRGIPGFAPGLNNARLFDGTRLEQLGFNGSLEAYVELTISAGRPVRSNEWPNPMPTWSQEFGGPMRPDEVRDVAAYVLNWGCTYDETCEPEQVAEKELLYVKPLDTAPATPEPAQEPADGGEEPGWAEVAASLPEGDAANGEAAFETYACNACHTITGVDGVAPSLLGIGDRIPDGYESAAHYLVESIWEPSAFVVSGFTDGLMPPGFKDQMSEQDIADIIAYLLSLK